MESMPNRKQRRQMAKDAGFLKMKSGLPFEKQLEMSRRASEFGRKIHISNVEQNLRNEEERLRVMDQKKIDFLISKGISPDEALKIVQDKNDSDHD